MGSAVVPRLAVLGDEGDEGGEGGEDGGGGDGDEGVGPLDAAQLHAHALLRVDVAQLEDRRQRQHQHPAFNLTLGLEDERSEEEGGTLVVGDAEPADDVVEEVVEPGLVVVDALVVHVHRHVPVQQHQAQEPHAHERRPPHLSPPPFFLVPVMIRRGRPWRAPPGSRQRGWRGWWRRRGRRFRRGGRRGGGRRG